jgi:hypothetical protein
MSSEKLNSQPFYFQLLIIGGFVFIALMLFALARSIYRDSFQVGSYIDRSRDFINSEQAATESEQSELAYAQTSQYQKKMAKELLGLMEPGEKVIILTAEDQSIEDIFPETAQRRSDRELEVMTNSEKWWRYLFGI